MVCKTKDGINVYIGELEKELYFYKEEYWRTPRRILEEQQLKDIALELNDGVEIDWKNRDRKYCIYFDYDSNDLYQEWFSAFRDIGIIFCLSDNFLEVAIERIGEEKLKQLIESGV